MVTSLCQVEEGELGRWMMEARGWKQLSRRAFGSPRKDRALELGRLGPDLHSSTPRSLQRRCDPFLMTSLSFAEVETCVLYICPPGSPNRLSTICCTICPGQGCAVRLNRTMMTAQGSSPLGSAHHFAGYPISASRNCHSSQTFGSKGALNELCQNYSF